MLDTNATAADLTRQIVDMASPSGHEAPLADAIEHALAGASHLEVVRVGNTVAARTTLGREARVLWAGHIDTVPVHNNLPSHTEAGVLYGRNSLTGAVEVIPRTG